MTDRKAIITSRLQQAFDPESLTVIDESADHFGHAGHDAAGSHFYVVISAKAFVGLSKVAAHRLIYDLFRDMVPEQIHALRIKVD